MDLYQVGTFFGFFLKMFCGHNYLVVAIKMDSILYKSKKKKKNKKILC